jgi:nucleoside-diphosphate-sugar epimerase
MRLLFLGGTRFVGRAIATAAAARGHEVAAFHRGTTGPDLPFLHLRGDRSRLTEHRAAIRAFRPDAVVDCNAYTEHHARAAAEVLDGLDVRMLALSSMDVYEVFRAALAHRAFGDFPVVEADPLSAERYYHGHAPIPEYDKNLVTEVVLEAGRAGTYAPTVFRLPMVFGPGDPQARHRHGDALHHVLDRRERYVIGATEQSEIWTFGYVDNVAAAVLHALDHPGTVGKAYNVGERRVRDKRRWAELYAAAAGHDLAFGPVPDRWVDPDRPADAPAAHLIFDSRAYADDTGFAEPIALETQVERTLAWATDHREALGDPPDYPAREALWERLTHLTTPPPPRSSC